jgi:ribosomal protein S10
MQMMTLKWLQLLKQTPCSRAPSAALCLLGAVAQQRCYQAAMDGSESHQSPDQDAVVSAGIGREQLQWAPRRSLPEPSVYSVKVVIKAHDLKFVKMASTVIRDLMLVNFSPKSRDVLPSHQSKGSPLPWVQLVRMVLIWNTPPFSRLMHFMTSNSNHKDDVTYWSSHFTACLHSCAAVLILVLLLLLNGLLPLLLPPDASYQAMPPGDVSLPIKRTHYTVIRGPHVHKSSREQFARTTHKRIISYATNNLSELNWFLDSLKLYQFQAVELVVKVTSSSYLLPTSTAEQAAAEQPLLQPHKQRFTHLFGAAAPGSTGGGNSSFSQQSLNGDSGSFAAVQQSLRGLQQAMHDGLLQQRMRLGSSTAYHRWREGLQGKSTAAATAAAAAAGEAGALPGQQLQDVAAQQVQGSGLLAQQEEQQQPQQESVQQAFMAAVDKVLLRLKLDVLDR